MNTQNNWRWCNRCQGLHYSLHPGRCVGGIPHQVAGSGDYTLTYGGGTGQNGWRWCRRCSHLWYGMLGPGICPAGGGHDPTGSGDYWIPHNDWNHPGQKGWKWCCRCQVLFYSGQGFGLCPAGGGHDPTGSGEYSLIHIPLGSGMTASFSVGMSTPFPGPGPMPGPGVQYQQTTVTTVTPGTPVTIPSNYIRPQYTYTVAYDPRQPFVVPVGVDQRVANRMLQASAIFRRFDKNYSGTLSFKEWKKAMKHLGYHMNKADKYRLFTMIDSDGSGYISELEFCEFWAVYGWP